MLLEVLVLGRKEPLSRLNREGNLFRPLTSAIPAAAAANTAAIFGSPPV